MNHPQKPNECLRLFQERGYFVVRASLAPAELRQLRAACDSVLESVRRESTTKGHTSPSIGLLANASHFACEPATLERLLTFVASPGTCALLDGLSLAGEESTPRFKKSDYYHEQTKHDWDGDWHRDSQFTEPDPERERALILASTFVHVRVAFEPDDRLEIVPGSHARWDTVDELGIRKGAKRTDPTMPHSTRVSLRAGDACVFHAFSIHRATYRRWPLRRTLDCLYAFGTTRNERFQSL